MAMGGCCLVTVFLYTDKMMNGDAGQSSLSFIRIVS